MQTFSEFRQELSEQQQLNEWVVLLGKAIAIILTGGGLGAGGWEIGKGIGDAARGIGDAAKESGANLSNNAVKISAVLAAAGVSAVAIRQFFKYLEATKMEKMRNEKDVEMHVAKALRQARINPMRKLNKAEAERIIDN